MSQFEGLDHATTTLWKFLSITESTAEAGQYLLPPPPNLKTKIQATLLSNQQTLFAQVKQLQNGMNGILADYADV